MNRCSLPDWVTCHVSESAKHITSVYMAALSRYKLEAYKKTIRDVRNYNLRSIFSPTDLQFKLLKMTKNMPIYGNLFLCFILTSNLFSLTESFHHAPHSYHIPIDATQSHHFTVLTVSRYCQTTHPPDRTIHLDPRSRPPAFAMGIPANMPTAYHYNHLWLLTPIPIPTPSTLTSRITILLELLDRTLETSFYTLATIYLATQSITEDLKYQEMVWYK